MRIRHHVILIAYMALAPESWAQHVIHRFEGTGPFDQLQACTTVGDLDGDGVTELALGSPNANSGSGRIWVVSGATFDTILGPLDGSSTDQGWGRFLLGLGDFDGDGVPDIAHGDSFAHAPDYQDGAIRVLSGSDLSELALISNPTTAYDGYGAQMWRAGDLDGDGHDDLFAGGINSTSSHLVEWPGSVVWTASGNSILGRAGDVNGDGHPDILAGYLNVGNYIPTFPEVYEYPGYVEIRSGVSDEVLVRGSGDPDLSPPWSPGQPIWQHFGAKATGVGDIDGDGVLDFAGAATMQGICDGTVDWGPGFLRIFSGADGHLIRQIDQVQDSSLWGCQFHYIEGGRDVNGDGVPDILATFRGAHAPGDFSIVSGHSRIYSGRTGSMLCLVHPGADWQGQGLLPDLSGDGIGDFYNGHPYTKDANGNVVGHGQVVLYAGFPGDAERICAQPANSSGQPARLTLDGPIDLDVNALDLLVEGAPPNEVGFFFYGPSEIALPVGDGILCAGPGSLGLQRIGGPVQLDGAGSYLLDLDNTQAPMGAGPADWNAGETWILQFGFRDTDAATQGGAGFGFSDAMRVTWWP